MQWHSVDFFIISYCSWSTSFVRHCKPSRKTLKWFYFKCCFLPNSINGQMSLKLWPPLMCCWLNVLQWSSDSSTKYKPNRSTVFEKQRSVKTESIMYYVFRCQYDRFHLCNRKLDGFQFEWKPANAESVFAWIIEICAVSELIEQLKVITNCIFVTKQ